VLPALATATVLLIAIPIYYGQVGPFQSDRPASMVTLLLNWKKLQGKGHPRPG
jgi:hypothetical protein